ncbi:MAG: hypothetical protein JJ979_19865 [Roseibium sp.]|nr:hypothetical protein [Roseibium sp.]
MAKFDKDYGGSFQGSESETRIRLDEHAKITLRGQPHVTVSSNQKACVLRRVDRPRVYTKFTNAELGDLIARGLLVQEDKPLSPFELRLKYEHEIQIWQLPEKVAHRVDFRRFICLEFLALEAAGITSRSDASMAVVISHIHAHWLKVNSKQRGGHKRFRSSRNLQKFRCPHPSTVRRWLRKFEAGDFKAMALCPPAHKRIIWNR